MPNDPSDLPSFPLPSLDDQTAPSPDTAIDTDNNPEPEPLPVLPQPPQLDQTNLQPEKTEVITDPVAPEITAPPVITTPPQPSTPPPVSTPEIPATPTPKHNNSSPLILVVLLVLVLISATGAFIFYQQTQKLKGQLTEISSIVNNQKIVTPTPTPEEIVIPTTTPTPTPEETATSSSSLQITKVYDQLPTILELASSSYPNAQLILVTAENANNSQAIIIKYWFRTDVNTKKYFYISRSPNTSLQLVDQQVYVTPDDNIASLTALYQSGVIGSDLDSILTLANSKCVNSTVCQSSPTKAQVIRTNSGTIWQITYTISGQTKPQIIQIDANSQKIIYQSTGYFTK